MGYSTRNNGHIKSFWPDDTETEFYLSENLSPTLKELIDYCNEKWIGCDFNLITIEPEYIHTDCLTYDLYDSSDYTKFIKITYYRTRN